MATKKKPSQTRMLYIVRLSDEGYAFKDLKYAIQCLASHNGDIDDLEYEDHMVGDEEVCFDALEALGVPNKKGVYTLTTNVKETKLTKCKACNSGYITE